MELNEWMKDFQKKNGRLPYADEVFEAGKESASLTKRELNFLYCLLSKNILEHAPIFLDKTGIHRQLTGIHRHLWNKLRGMVDNTRIEYWDAKLGDEQVKGLLNDVQN